jgi:hypothetical protein
MKNKIKYWFKSLHPSYWIQNYPYNSEWDKWLNEAMDKDKFVIISKFEASISGVTIWISNHPNASFTPYTNSSILNMVRPKRSTIVRAWEKLLHDTLDDELENIQK